MTWTELLDSTVLGQEIHVTLIKPLRRPRFEGDDTYTHGKVTGFKSGQLGGGYYNYKKDKDMVRSMPHSFETRRIHWLKKPRVQVTYPVFDWGGKEHSDWVDVDNCIFEIISKSTDNG